MDAKIVHFVFRFIARVLAIGASVIFGIVLGFLLQRERAKELVAEIGRLMKGNRDHILAPSGIKEEPEERTHLRADL